MSAYRPIRPLLYLCGSFLAQIIGFAIGISFGHYFPLDYQILILIHSAVAAGISVLLRLPLPWILFNILAPLSLLPSVPLILIQILGVFLVALYVPTFWTRVPYFPSSRKAPSAMASVLNTSDKIVFIDLGSGFGTVLFKLAKKFPNGQFVGAEISPLALGISKLRSYFYSNVTIVGKSFWKLPLADYTHIYAFLSPQPMSKLWDKVKSESKPGATFIVNSFAG